MQLLNLKQNLILLISPILKNLAYTGFCELDIWNCFEREQCLLSYIQIALVLKLQVVSALQIIVSVRYGS